MRDSTVQTSRLITTLLWTVVSLLLAASWVTWATGTRSVWMMLAFTGCLTSAVAAVSQIRCYTLRVCGLLRATGVIEGERTPELHSLR